MRLTNVLAVAALGAGLLLGAPAVQAQCSCDLSPGSSTWRWEEITPLASPPGRTQGVLVYDAARERAVLVGGIESCGNRTPIPAVDFTWEFDGIEWHRVTTATTPPGRYHAAIAYDSVRAVVVMFGGSFEGQPSSYGDTWEYDGSNWREVTPPHSPGPCATVYMAYDPVRHRVVLRTGDGAGHTCVAPGSTWEYDGTDWWQVQTATNPPASDHVVMLYDSGRQRVALFDHQSNQVWEYDGANWQFKANMACDEVPLAFDSVGQRFVMARSHGWDANWEFSPMGEWDGNACPLNYATVVAPPPGTSHQRQPSISRPWVVSSCLVDSTTVRAVPMRTPGDTSQTRTVTARQTLLTAHPTIPPSTRAPPSCATAQITIAATQIGLQRRGMRLTRTATDTCFAHRGSETCPESLAAGIAVPPTPPFIQAHPRCATGWTTIVMVMSMKA